ncbi:hypothetical protein M407DRAFT_28514 [Tulasnella calospora MUT 4182]|uniref:ABM domain-containing protein n=1 Tax=Tulasnella calospora MUT 4182 TaxID=1051891 RepID=A0A0C3LKM7_9AGAM|nr:hypothetical protein M407DRAFT_28514 [Tulasnella calospora MUT 4182]
MSQDPSQFEAGKFVLCARLETISKDAADELAEFLLAIKRDLGEKEPGCLTYRVCQFENMLMIFEEYADQEAFNLHKESEGAKAFWVALETRLQKPPAFEFYREL